MHPIALILAATLHGRSGSASAVVLGRSGSATADVAAQEPASASAKGKAEPGLAGLDVVWADSFSDAVEKAKKIPGGRILIEFVDDNCAACGRQETFIVPTTSFYAFTRDKVPVRLSRSSTDGRRLAARFGVQGVPTWMVVTPDLLMCGVLAGLTNQSQWFQTFAETERSWALYKQKLEEEAKDPGNVALVFAIAEETFKRSGDDLAEPRFARLAKEPKASPEMRERSLAYLTSIQMDQMRIEEAARNLETLLETAKDPVLRERAELRLADVEIARGRKDRAVKRLQDFKKAHPASPFAAEADELLRVLKPATQVSQ